MLILTIDNLCQTTKIFFSKILNRNLTSISGFFNLVSATGNVEGSEDDIDNSEQGPHGLGLGGSLPLTSLNAMQLALCNHYALHSKL